MANKPKKISKGYTASDITALRTLLERIQPNAGDYVGSGTVTIEKTKKKMARGGIVGAPARSYKDMRAGAGSGVGRIQKAKIAGRGR